MGLVQQAIVPVLSVYSTSYTDNTNYTENCPLIYKLLLGCQLDGQLSV